MLALCLMLSVTYYAQNYAGIIGWSLLIGLQLTIGEVWFSGLTAMMSNKLNTANKIKFKTHKGTTTTTTTTTTIATVIQICKCDVGCSQLIVYHIYFKSDSYVCYCLVCFIVVVAFCSYNVLFIVLCMLLELCMLCCCRCMYI